MRPSKADGGLERILLVGSFVVDGGEEGGDDVGQARRGRRRGRRRALGAVGSYLCLGARCKREALNWR